jgi:PAS domain S-box-containing protein
MQGYRIGEVAPSYASWAARVHPDDLPGTEAAIAAARGSRGEFVHEFRSVHPDGSTHWLLARGRFFYDEAGEPLRMVGAMLDVTERREWEERQKVLVAELQHRTFNLMGVVRSTADAALRRSADLDEFKARFNDRIAVLARVQRLLSKLKEEQRVTFDELVRGELESVGAFDTPGRVTLDGPDGVALRSSGVQTFALALHELATNAVKYGALSQPGARLGVRWCVHADDAGAPWLHVEWRESGVAMPACAQPQGTGQGRDLIEKALPYQLRAKTEYRMTADGVKCSIALPVSRHRMVETGAASLEEWRG